MFSGPRLAGEYSSISMPDPRINRDNVLATIYAAKNRRRVIWTASTTLATMEIESYPHRPPTNYRRMKKVLKGLCDEGLIVQRPKVHSHFTLKETAYQRDERLPENVE